MARRRTLLTVWNWLPAFQVVAETEHLPTASARLKVTPSALSRSISMLEDRLGRRLFTRRGRQLVLNADGRRLLAGMSTAFAALDKSVAGLSGGDLGGPLYASAAGPLAQSLVVPALHGLRARGGGLVPYVYGYDHDEAIRLIRAEQLDVVFGTAKTESGDLVNTFIGEADNGVYCGREHPLFAARAAEAPDVLQHAFVATCSAGGDRPTDAFPADVARHVEMFVHQTSVALDTCLAGHLLAVLPEFVARGLVREGNLRALPFAGLPPTLLFATYGRERANDARVMAVVAAAGEALSAALERPPAEARTSRRTSSVLLAPSAPDEEEWLTAGDELSTRGELRAARAAYDDAHQRRRRANGDVVADDARHALRVARLLVHQGEYAEAEKRCVEAIASLAGREATVAAALEAVTALACCFRGEDVRARASLDRARAYVAAEEGRRDRGADRLRALVHRAEGNLLVLLGRPHDAIGAYGQSAIAAEAGGDAWEHSIALFNLAEAHAMVGDSDRADRLLGAAAGAKEAIGDRWGLAHVHHLRARLALGAHRAEGAIEEALSALRLAADLGDPKLVAMCNATLGDAHLARGEHDEAQRTFELARQDAERCGARAEAIRALVGLSATHLRRANRVAARRCAKQANALALEDGEGGGRGGAIATTLIALADVASADESHADAAALYRDALVAQQDRDRWPMS